MTELKIVDVGMHSVPGSELFKVARYVFSVRLCPGRIYQRIEKKGWNRGVGSCPHQLLYRLIYQRTKRNFSVFVHAKVHLLKHSSPADISLKSFNPMWPRTWADCPSSVSLWTAAACIILCASLRAFFSSLEVGRGCWQNFYGDL